jgi:hypothetical protein
MARVDGAEPLGPQRLERWREADYAFYTRECEVCTGCLQTYPPLMKFRRTFSVIRETLF